MFCDIRTNDASKYFRCSVSFVRKWLQICPTYTYHKLDVLIHGCKYYIECARGSYSTTRNYFFTSVFTDTKNVLDHFQCMFLSRSPKILRLLKDYCSLEKCVLLTKYISLVYDIIVLHLDMVMEYLCITDPTSSLRRPKPTTSSGIRSDRFPRNFGLLLVSPWHFFLSALPP